MSSDIEQAIRQICDEKGLSYEAVMETVETALAAAYRKDYGNRMQNIEVEFDPASGSVKAFDVKEVVEDLPEELLQEYREQQAAWNAQEDAQKAAMVFAPKKEGEEGEAENSEEKPAENESSTEEGEEMEEAPLFNPKTEIMVSDAQVLKMGASAGDIIRTELPVAEGFGRMAAMTAKQVITQKLREAEREIIFNEYKEHEGEVLIGTVQRQQGRVILVDLGRTTGIILPDDQIRREQYNPGDRVKVFVREVSLGARGAQIILSRASEELVRVLFELEIPEIADGTVQIKGIAREAGARSKVAVYTEDDSIDPIGACIGQRGVRIQTIIGELGGEKIDVIEWNDDAKAFIAAALAPAKISSVELNEEEQAADVIVAEDQLSLAIGRGGQNVRLAARLSGWKLNVSGDGEGEQAEIEDESLAAEEGASSNDAPAAEEDAVEASEEVTEASDNAEAEAEETTEDNQEAEA